jgi:DNA polymerase elongation subunit (family B)
MRVLNNFNEKDVLFIDIETIRCEENLTPESQMYEAWKYKARYGNEMSRKTGEPATDEEFFVEKAALYAPFAKVVCVTLAKKTPEGLKKRTYYGEDEAEILASLAEDLVAFKRASPKTVFCGFNIVGFDMPMLTKRMLVNRVPLPEMLDVAHKKPWDVEVIDLSLLWKGTSFYQDSFVAVCAAMGVPSPKQGLDGSQVSDAYYEGRLEEIAKYCDEDVLATARLYYRFLNIEEELNYIN